MPYPRRQRLSGTRGSNRPGLPADRWFWPGRNSTTQPEQSRDIRGILGNTFIKDYIVEIDYARRALTFYSPEVFNLSQEARSLPMQMRDGIPFVQLSLSLGDATTVISGQFEIDSGFSGSLEMNRPFAERHLILDRVPKSLVEVGIGGAGVGGDMKSMNAGMEQGISACARVAVGRAEENDGLAIISKRLDGCLNSGMAAIGRKK